MNVKNLTSFLLALTLSGSSIGVNFSADISAKAADTAETLAGDVNGDGKVSIADAVMLWKWIVKSDSELTNWKNADLYKDNIINSTDLVLLRRKLISGEDNSLYSGLVINEVCTSNKDSFKDSNNKSPDWVEIYNSSSKDIDISGVGLSEGNKKRYKFSFPENTLIKSDSYIIVACDKELTTVGIDFVAPFNLSASGETVYLTAPALSDGSSGADIDIVTVPALGTDITYGRFKNGSGTFEYLSPSPEAANTTKQADFVEAPLFSQEAGFYDDEFKLALSSDKSDVIYYTTDGSDPKTSKTAAVYDGEITIYNNTSQKNNLSARTDITYMSYSAPSDKVDKGIIVRAACRDDDGNWSSVVTKGYYVGKDESYSNIKVVSLSTDSDNLFNKENGIYVLGTEGEAFRGQVVSGQENSTGNPANYNKEDKNSLDWERPVNMQVYDNGKLAYTGDLGIRISGNWSKGYAQKSFRITARSKYGPSKIKYSFFDDLVDINGNKIKEFDDIVLHNGGSDNIGIHSRDELHHSFVEDIDSISVQASEPCVVFINGEYWGMYYIREKFNNDYIKDHYGIKNSTVVKQGQYDGNPQKYFEYTSLLSWGVTADMSVEENYRKVESAIDLDNFIDYMTVQSYINNKDWLSKTSTNNWAVWVSDEIDETNPFADGKWRFTLFDTDQGGGPWDQNDYKYNRLTNLNRRITAKNFGQLFYNLLNNQEFRERFEKRYTEIVSEYFDYSLISPKLDKLDSELSSYIKKSYDRFSVNRNSFDNSLNNMKLFYKNRASYAIDHMKYLLANYKDYVFIDDSASETQNMLKYLATWRDADFENANGEYDFISATEQTVDVQKLGEYEYSVQSIYDGLILEKGKRYQLSFTASCEKGNGKICASLSKQIDPWDAYIDEEIDVTTKPKTFTFTSKPMEETENFGGIVFSYNYTLDKYHISDICVTELE